MSVKSLYDCVSNFNFSRQPFASLASTTQRNGTPQLKVARLCAYAQCGWLPQRVSFVFPRALGYLGVLPGFFSHIDYS